MDITFNLLIPVVLGYFAGHYLDVYFTTSFPVWTVFFTFLGMVTGMWGVYKRYIR